MIRPNPAYSTYARAAALRRDNLRRSAEDFRLHLTKSRKDTPRAWRGQSRRLRPRTICDENAGSKSTCAVCRQSGEALNPFVYFYAGLAHAAGSGFGQAPRFEDPTLASVESRQGLDQRLTTIFQLFVLDQDALLARQVIDQPILPFAGVAVPSDRRIERGVPAEPTVHLDYPREALAMSELRALPDHHGISFASVDTLIDDRGFGWVPIIFPGDQSIAECISALAGSDQTWMLIRVGRRAAASP